METSSIRLGKIHGVPIGASWSLLLVALVIGVSLAEARYPSDYVGHTSTAYWLAAALTVVAFFASILAHELGHALVARARGLEVDGITLWFLGGVTRMRGELDGPGTDAGIAAIGPITSGALGLGFLGASATVDAWGLDPLVGGVFEWLGIINLALAAFNALPAAPLDGGSVLAAAVWWRTGDRPRGRAAAAISGQLLGGALAASGLWMLMGDGSDIGLWNLLLGMFIFQAARSERPSAATASPDPGTGLPPVRMDQLAPLDPPVVDDTTTIDELIGMLGAIGEHTAFAVRDGAGVLSSAVLISDLRGVPPIERATSTARTIAIDLAGQITAWASETTTEITPRIDAHGAVRVIAVYDPQVRLVSLVTSVDMSRFADAYWRRVDDSAG